MRSTQIHTFLHSKFLWEGSQRVGVSASRETDLEYSAFIRSDGSAVLIVLNRYVKCSLCADERKFFLLNCVFVFCRSPSVIQFEVWDPAVGYIPSTAPAHSLLTLAWNTHWSLIHVRIHLFPLNHITSISMHISTHYKKGKPFMLEASHYQSSYYFEYFVGIKPLTRTFFY